MVAPRRALGQLAIVATLVSTPLLGGCFGFSCIEECESSAIVAVYRTIDGRYSVEANDGVTSFRCDVVVRGESCSTTAPCTSVDPSATGFGVFCPSGTLVSWTPGAAIAITTSNFTPSVTVHVTDPNGRVTDRVVAMHYETRCGCPAAMESIDL